MVLFSGIKSWWTERGKNHELARDRARGALLGLAIGDAVGTTVEFKRRGTFEPVTDMVGGGHFKLPAGKWTDDTSMALCLAESLVECDGMDPKDQMERYAMWASHGYLSSTGECFDIGNTVYDAISKYRAHGDPFAGSRSERSAGNGSIMRLAPVPISFFPKRDKAIHAAIESSKTTHGAQECLDACALLCEMIINGMEDRTKEETLSHWTYDYGTSPKVAAIAAGSYRNKTMDHIIGNGYVVNSLEAASWCVATTDSFREAILKATNLGDDADTTAAICGQIAGALYGYEELPKAWVRRCYWNDRILQLADSLIAS